MRRISPKIEAQAAVALAAGFQVVSVAEQTGLSISTVKRIKVRSGVRSGSMRGVLVDEAKAGFKAGLSSEFAANAGAQLVHTQVALVDRIQTGAAITLERLERQLLDEEIDLHQAAKTLSACATSAKLAADGLCRVLRLAAEPEVAEALPTLEVRDMLEEEIADLRAEQERERVAWGIQSPSEEEGS
ncbi:hypothetical protein [Aeromonas media]|uniref:hypothetical protein n=1 Tax=Aeromonas media TaxID=651 RepID=UPI00384F7CF1